MAVMVFAAAASASFSAHAQETCNNNIGGVDTNLNKSCAEVKKDNNNALLALAVVGGALAAFASAAEKGKESGFIAVGDADSQQPRSTITPFMEQNAYNPDVVTMGFRYEWFFK